MTKAKTPKVKRSTKRTTGPKMTNRLFARLFPDATVRWSDLFARA
jgi:hypothetical protein